MRRLHIRRFVKETKPNLSATWHPGGSAGGLGMRGGGSVTFDEALDLIDREQKRRDLAKARRAETLAAGVGGFRSLKQAGAFANMLARQTAKRGKVKMPRFSIQDTDE